MTDQRTKAMRAVEQAARAAIMCDGMSPAERTA